MGKEQFIEAGKIVNTHGIAGEVKIEVWLNSPAFLKKCGRIFVGERELVIRSGREHKGFLLAKLEDIDDVNAAMQLKGRTVKINREDAPLGKGEFFLQDIIGASVVDDNGAAVGTLTEIIEMPSGNVYVVKGEKEHLIPAVPEFILSSDAEAGIIRVHMIEGM